LSTTRINKRVSLTRRTREVYLPEASAFMRPGGSADLLDASVRPDHPPRGSFPKHLRCKLAQSNRPGFGRLFCPSSIRTAANVRCMERGASSPKYRIPCLRASGKCCIRICRNFSAENRSVWSLSFLVSFARYSTERRCYNSHRASASGGVPTGPTTHTRIAYCDRLISKAEDGGTDEAHTLASSATVTPSGVHSASQCPNDCAEAPTSGQETLYVCSCTLSTTHPGFSWRKS
jgi:hypothetical protein